MPYPEVGETRQYSLFSNMSSLTSKHLVQRYPSIAGGIMSSEALMIPSLIPKMATAQLGFEFRKQEDGAKSGK